MADFFKLNSDTEDKVIIREERILRDAIAISGVTTIQVSTTSKAPRQKVKFFLDAIRTGIDTVAITKYYELEHTQKTNNFRYYTMQPTHTRNYAIWDVAYTCSENDGNGNYTLTFTPSFAASADVEIYISAVVIQDSYFDATKGWLNPDNPDNINAAIIALPNISTNIRTNTEIRTSEWLNGKPIFSQYFSFTVPTTTDGVLVFTILKSFTKNYFDSIVDMSGVISTVDAQGNEQYLPLQIVSETIGTSLNLTAHLKIYTSGEQVRLVIVNTAAAFALWKGNATIRYTRK